jgi:hypothetical protein
MSIILLLGCGLGIFLTGMFLVLGFFSLMGAGGRDTVSAAREDWLQRRSEKDQEAW